MVSPTAIAVVVVLVLAAAVAVYLATRPPPTPDLANPPPGYFSNEPIPPPAPGDKWPKNVCAGTAQPYFLMARGCVGRTPGLVNGGSGKCTNATNTAWSGCVHTDQPRAE